MDKSCQSSGDSSITSTSSRSSTGTSGRDQYLKHVNKLSHKISKPLVRKPGFDPPLPQNQNQNQNFNTHQVQLPAQDQAQPQQPPPPPPPPPPQAAAASQAQQQQQQSLQAQQHQHQPPVYNINKNDFRDVVQKLTGSPAYDRFSAPPPPIHNQQPKAASSRLQRIRPPPLAHLSNRPPPLLNGAVPPPRPAIAGAQPLAPLSPLPPLPAVHGAAESPVSAYMRYLQNSVFAVDSNQKQASGFSPLAPLVSPRWSNLAPPQTQPVPPPQPGMLPPPPPPQPAMMPSNSQLHLPLSSPLPFSCLNSPRSPYPLLSPSLLLSPSSGQLGFPQLPLSPTVPVPSPRWRGF
ncbi:VQ motif containing protein [Parasponia andersonii]|uniref:VQ motif containing protein n=1 Tax=Parasponia andersonii TaxID=3476 RepID=A0A2P5A715_PARAD|nr:VQ motif containing protein [Parasponia andersonii]